MAQGIFMAQGAFMAQGIFMATHVQDTYEVEIEEVAYLRHGETDYMARIFRPQGAGPFPAAVEVHGGAWRRGSREGNDSINGAVASGGVVVAALDFRNPPAATYPGSVADVNYGIRWLKAHAADYDTRPELVGVMGTSSGGHLAVLAAIKPDDARYAAAPLDGGDGIDARVPFVVTLWPVICPLSRYRIVGRRIAGGGGDERQAGLLEDQMEYWLTEEAMEEGSANLIVNRDDEIDMPKMLYLQHPDDPLHPRENMDSFIAGYRKRGGAVDRVLTEGDSYDAIRSQPSSAGAKDSVRRIVAFIHRASGRHAFGRHASGGHASGG